MSVRAFLILAALLLPGLWPGAVSAATPVDSFPAGTIDSEYPVNPGTTRVIYQYGTCAVITNNTQNALYVPLASATEWNGPNGIIAYPPPGVTVQNCLRCELNLGPGNTSFTAPAAYDNMTVTLSSGGGGGGSYVNYYTGVDWWDVQCGTFGWCCTIYYDYAGSNGGSGGDSTFNTLSTPMIAGNSGGGGCGLWQPPGGICAPGTSTPSSGPNGPNPGGVNPLVTTINTGGGAAGGGGGCGCIYTGGCGEGYTWCGCGYNGGNGTSVVHTYNTNDNDLAAPGAGASPAFGGTINLSIGGGGGGGGSDTAWGQSGTNGSADIIFLTNTPYPGATCTPE